MPVRKQPVGLTTDEQIRTMESQLNSPDANFTLLEKMQYLNQYFDNDPMFSKEARNIVRANIAKQMSNKNV